MWRMLIKLITHLRLGGGGGLTLTWRMYICLPLSVLFRKIWYSDRFSSETKESKLHRLGVF